MQSAISNLMEFDIHIETMMKTFNRTLFVYVMSDLRKGRLYDEEYKECKERVSTSFIISIFGYLRLQLEVLRRIQERHNGS